MQARDMQQAVLVNWVDSCGCSGWRRLSNEDSTDKNRTTIAVCRTVGYIVRQNKDEVVLVSQVDETTDNCDHVMAIPRRVVKSIELLEVSHARQGKQDRRQVQGDNATQDKGQGDHEG